ncbi:2,3-dihydro-2,3-dihydroxybenzoate dehydrogenase [Chitinimonas lacunae]|uniref:2,3-dihydro-2,3-dihydroxybenzoate dehydrogenase n=1 Tax=Chitinimonas lacunae TaxID=1963018 RepID=A0ABV8MKM7_9NEIS
MEFQGKVALVTGAAQGIGAAVARMLAGRGAKVALLDRQADAVEAVAASLRVDGRRALGFGVDVTDAERVRQMIDVVEQELGPIDVLANVAAILRMGRILELSDADWDDTFSVNVRGVFNVSRAVANRMVQRRSGAIVTVASNAADVPRMKMAAYAASKAASAHFTRCLGLELAEYGIRCNVVSPGSTDTAMQRQLWTGPESEQAVIRGSLDDHRLGIPTGRMASPEDIAEAVCFLASDRARQITMHDLRVDGGATLGA